MEETVLQSLVSGTRRRPLQLEDQSGSGGLSVVSLVSPSRVQRISYRNCKRQLARAFQDNPNFEDGLLLETTEKGVWYPVVHLASLSPRGILAPRQQLLKPGALGSDFVLKQGLYRELRFLEPYTGESETARLKRRQNSLDDHPFTWVILGFTGLSWGGNEALEDTWKDWTGVRYLYLNLPEALGLSKISLLRRIDASDVTLFTYIVLLEFTDVTSKNEAFLTDFMQRFRAERAKGFLSLYREAPGSSSSVSSSDSSANEDYSSASDVSSDDFILRRVRRNNSSNNDRVFL